MTLLLCMIELTGTLTWNPIPNQTSSQDCVGMYRLFLIYRGLISQSKGEHLCGWAGPLMSVFSIALPWLFAGTSAHKTIKPSIHCCTGSWRTGRKSSTFLLWWALTQERSHISTGNLHTRYTCLLHRRPFSQQMPKLVKHTWHKHKS